jgi:hypothetical protein
VVIHDLYVVCSVSPPAATDTPLIVDTDAVLALAFALKGVEPIARRDANVLEASGGVQLIQLSECDGLHGAPEFALPGEEEAVGVLALEGLNHGLSI